MNYELLKAMIDRFKKKQKQKRVCKLPGYYVMTSKNNIVSLDILKNDQISEVDEDSSHSDDDGYKKAEKAAAQNLLEGAFAGNLMGLGQPKLDLEHMRKHDLTEEELDELKEIRRQLDLRTQGGEYDKSSVVGKLKKVNVETVQEMHDNASEEQSDDDYKKP